MTTSLAPRSLLPLLGLFVTTSACVVGNSYEPSDDPESSLTTEAVLGGRAIAPTLGDARRIELDSAGYNPRFLGIEEPWESKRHDFAGALTESAASMIRYPGGTFANAWDYKNDRLFPSKTTHETTGWVDLDRIAGEPEYDLVKEDRRPTYSVDDLATVASGANAVRVVFHMNMVTPGRDFYESPDGWNRTLDPHPGTSCFANPDDDWCKMLDNRYQRFHGMLMRAQAKGIPIKLVELGNEYYFAHDYTKQAFPRADALGRAANYIASRVHQDFGADVNVATVASRIRGSDDRAQSWNKDLASTLDNDKVDAVTLHAYKQYALLDAYTEASFQRNLVDWLGASNGLFRDSDADSTFIGKTKIWYTETNANWDGAADEVSGADGMRWAQSLVDAFSAIYLYERGSASIMLQFQFNNQVRDTAVDGHLLYNRALALQPLMIAAAGATMVTPLRFGGSDLPELPDSDRSVVQGVCFGGPAAIKRCFVMNLGRAGVKLDLRKVFPGATTGTLDGYRHALNDTDVAEAFSRTPDLGTMTLPGYSSAVVAPAP